MLPAHGGPCSFHLQLDLQTATASLSPLRLFNTNTKHPNTITTLLSTSTTAASASSVLPHWLLHSRHFCIHSCAPPPFTATLWTPLNRPGKLSSNRQDPPLLKHLHPRLAAPSLAPIFTLFPGRALASMRSHRGPSPHLSALPKSCQPRHSPFLLSTPCQTSPRAVL